MAVEGGASGLQVLYGKDLLAKVEAEQRAKVKDPKTKTPTGFALGEMKATELRTMVSAAGALSREIEEAEFSGEKIDSYKGKPARMLSFTLALDKVPEKDRKYVKKFEGRSTCGSPPTARAGQRLPAGPERARLRGGQLHAENRQTRQYGVSGDHLLLLRKENKSTSSGMGERVESRVVKTLQLQS